MIINPTKFREHLARMRRDREQEREKLRASLSPADHDPEDHEIRVLVHVDREIEMLAQLDHAVEESLEPDPFLGQ